MRAGSVLLALALAQPLAAAASTAQAERAAAPARAAAAEKAGAGFDQKRFDELRKAGFDALYNLDYEGARKTFRELTRVYPEHPAGYQFLAAGLWLKTLNESRRLQASLYNDEGFYKEEDDKADPKVSAEFKELTRRTKELCDARLKRDPKDAEALYYLGASEGLKSAWGAMVERSFMSALRNGNDAVDHHKEVIKIDPAFKDAKVTIGMYDYVVGSLPLPVKLLASIGGFRGSKKRGLAALEEVAREGRWASDDAKSVLIALLKRERRFRDAYVYANELGLKYPRNYLFKMEAADALVSQAEVDRATDPAAAKKTEAEAFALFESLLATGSRAPLDLVRFSYGEALLVAGHSERAAREYLAAASHTGAEATTATRARLRAAQALDLAGRRDEAVAHYKAVLARPNVYDSHEEAKRGLKGPYRLTRRAGEPAAAAEEAGAANAQKAN